jgi:hypothetical protein
LSISPKLILSASAGKGPREVPKPTIETGVKAMTLAVLSAFDQHARGK